MSTTSKRLSHKSALITGGNSGIGLATARLFVVEGARVAITDRNQKTLDAAAAELGGRPRQISQLLLNSFTNSEK
jgi:NAD(P)-dependent dehydrogenase (short-subunit alcohol dehydrogenase family)